MNWKDSFTYRKRTKLSIALVFVSALIAVGLSLLRMPTPGLANTPDATNMRNLYPIMVGSRIDTCTLCHTASIPSLNPFGAAYKSNGRSSAALTAIQNLDSDGDGFTNLAEINALTFPGDPADFPKAASATSTQTSTKTSTPTRTSTNVPASATPTRTSTSVPASPTRTSTNPPASATPTRTSTNAPAPATPTKTYTSQPTATNTFVPAQPTASKTFTEVPATQTYTPQASATKVATQASNPRASATPKPKKPCKSDSSDSHEKEKDVRYHKHTPTSVPCAPKSSPKKSATPTKTAHPCQGDDCQEKENQPIGNLDDNGKQASLDQAMTGAPASSGSLFDAIVSWFEVIFTGS